MTEHPYLIARDLRRSFGATVAVDDVTVELGRGEIVGLVGENGAGKSTLISLLTGSATPDAGSIEVAGHPHRALAPTLAKGLGLVAIRQEPVLVPTLAVWENLVLGREARRLGFLSRSRSRAMAREWLDRIGADVSLDAPTGTLSPADRQLVEIARAVGPGAAVLFFDEPTAALGPAETRRLYALIRQLAADGTGIAYVSHRLEEVFEVCERVVVMRDGRVVDARPTGAFDEQSLVAAMAGRELASDLARSAATQRADTPVVLRTRGVSVGAHLRDVDLEVHAGEIHAIAGIVGSGRSTLVGAIAGLTPITGGQMTIEEAAYRPSSPRDALDSGVVLVPEDRVRDGIFADLSQAANTVVARASGPARRGLVTGRSEEAAAMPFLRRVRVRPDRPGSRAGLLSGGNQQKVLLARALFTGARVLLLDEPTRGIDVHAKAEIHDLIRSQASEGVAVVVVSSDLREVLALADTVTVLSRGRVAGSFVAPLDGESIVAAATASAA